MRIVDKQDEIAESIKAFSEDLRFGRGVPR